MHPRPQAVHNAPLFVGVKPGLHWKHIGLVVAIIHEIQLGMGHC